MIAVYTALMSILLLAAYPLGMVLSLFGRTYVRDRLSSPGLLRDPSGADGRRFWIHAASVGESGIAFSFAAALKKKHPGSTVVVSTVTSTGLANIRARDDAVGGGVVDVSHLAPFDHPVLMTRWLRRVRPAALIIVETEIWPWLILSPHGAGIPVVIVNAKLGKRAFRRYRLLRGSVRRIMSRISLVCAQSREFAGRYRRLGVPRQNIEVLGNIKFDGLADRSALAPEALRAALGIPDGARVIVAGSTRPGEEDVLAAAFESVLRHRRDVFLVIAPRHLARLGEVTSVLTAHGLAFVTRSSGEKPDPERGRVVMLDTMGELMNAFALADAAFVGGSLRDFGGHNPLEPAALGVPVLFGPYMEQTGAKELLDGGAAMLVHDDGTLADRLLDLLNDEPARFAMAEAGPEVVRRFRGTLDRTIECMTRRGIIT